jgi:hypothetical protein
MEMNNSALNTAEGNMDFKIEVPSMRFPVRQGSAKDRGQSDKWYARDRVPHFYVGGTYTSKRIDEPFMTVKEVAEYNQGYDETSGGWKHPDQ